MKDIGNIALHCLENGFEVTKKDIGSDAVMKKRGIAVTTECYDVKDAGHLCIMRIRAMLGIMKAETVVFAPHKKDLPLFNVDRFSMFGREMLLGEIYDDQLAPCPEALTDRFEKIKQRCSDLEDMKQEPHWYDSLLYSCSFSKMFKKDTKRLLTAANSAVKAYLMSLAAAPICDEKAKAAKVREFALKLCQNGGSSVDTMKKSFGDEAAKHIVVELLYGSRA